MRSLLLILALSACAAFGEQAPALDRSLDDAMARAAKAGGCVRVVCAYPPVTCGPSAGRCQP